MPPPPPEMKQAGEASSQSFLRMKSWMYFDLVPVHQSSCW
eukprot:CAMPEP_0198552748 /NCGR_PEP_ID=MMETSP1462-20131121/79199_1 /TAXON_ID=1333877 /ORGANISM="Brandtodinium nutriculum, Strain RCC3387" /LENGTH=39 /DNA_ID= /DNA_START= /DNA_END= /DNA_ORIENTATION=